MMMILCSHWCTQTPLGVYSLCVEGLWSYDSVLNACAGVRVCIVCMCVLACVCRFVVHVVAARARAWLRLQLSMCSTPLFDSMPFNPDHLSLIMNSSKIAFSFSPSNLLGSMVNTRRQARQFHIGCGCLQARAATGVDSSSAILAQDINCVHDGKS